MKNLHLVQHFDKQHRLLFAEYSQNHPDGNYEFSSRIVFTGECIFRLHGHANTQTARIWRQSDLVKEIKYPPIFQVLDFCRISEKKIIDPYKVEGGTVTGGFHRQLLIRKVLPHLASLRSDFFSGGWSFAQPSYQITSVLRPT